MPTNVCEVCGSEMVKIFSPNYPFQSTCEPFCPKHCEKLEPSEDKCLICGDEHHTNPVDKIWDVVSHISNDLVTRSRGRELIREMLDAARQEGFKEGIRMSQKFCDKEHERPELTIIPQDKPFYYDK